MVIAVKPVLGPPAPGPFAAILRERRTRYNALFAEARRFHPLLDADIFADHLARVVAPLVDAAARLDPGAAERVADALYELSLALVGREYLGRRSRYPAINQAWGTLLPALAGHLVQDPARVAGAVTNALHTLSATPGARPSEWIALLKRAALFCPDPATLLLAGQAAAWVSGMAHYRLAALEVCARLDPALLCAIFDQPARTSMAETIDHLRSDPWWKPGRPSSRSEIRIVARAGGFRGFGGPFLVPPVIAGSEDTAFLVSEAVPGEANRTWRLYADCFGATLVRGIPAGSAPTTPAHGRISFSIGGEVRTAAARKVFPQLAGASGSAENGVTLAVSLQFSHHITLLAQAE
jgi:hypothetical protein